MTSILYRVITLHIHHYLLLAMDHMGGGGTHLFQVGLCGQVSKYGACELIIGSEKGSCELIICKFRSLRAKII